MNTKRVGIIMNGVTGRMGTNQHLVRSICAIREQGGIRIGDKLIMPDPLLVGRNKSKLRKLAEEHANLCYTTNLAEALSSEDWDVYFDSQTTELRYASVMKAISAGKHVYCEKPVASNFMQALNLYQHATEKHVKNGVVQDKLWLPGLIKLKRLIDEDFFGCIVEVRGEFGYWVFDGSDEKLQRPSWNYRKCDGGGIILDMLCHWRYVIDNLFGEVKSLTCLGLNNIKERWNENGKKYIADAEDAAFATILTKNGVVCQFNSSWCTRVNREDLLVIQVDGTKGSAVAGLHGLKVQSINNTPRCVWNPDVDEKPDYPTNWRPVYENEQFENAFKMEWELFLRHIVLDEPFKWNLKEGAKGVQFAELAYKSWKERRWIDVPPLE